MWHDVCKLAPASGEASPTLNAARSSGGSPLRSRKEPTMMNTPRGRLLLSAASLAFCALVVFACNSSPPAAADEEANATELAQAKGCCWPQDSAGCGSKKIEAAVCADMA